MAFLLPNGLPLFLKGDRGEFFPAVRILAMKDEIPLPLAMKKSFPFLDL